jgi:hypothetical protein
MTTLIVTLPPGLAKRLARAADELRLSHDELAQLALRLFIRAQSIPPPQSSHHVSAP